MVAGRWGRIGTNYNENLLLHLRKTSG
jgi:hypothetical protein